MQLRMENERRVKNMSLRVFNMILMKGKSGISGFPGSAGRKI